MDNALHYLPFQGKTLSRMYFNSRSLRDSKKRDDHLDLRSTSFSVTIFEVFQRFSNLSFMVFALPYSPRVRNGALKFYTCNPQRISCIAIHCICLILTISSVQVSFHGSKIMNDPRRLLTIFSSIASTLLHCSWTYIGFRNKRGFKSILKTTFSLCTQNQADENTARKMKLLSYFAYANLLGNVIFNIIYFGESLNYQEGPWKWVDSIFIKIFNSHGWSTAGILEMEKPLKLTFLVVALLTRTFLWIFGQLPEIFFTTLCLTFYLLSVEFWAQIHADRTNDLARIYALYRQVKALTGKLNHIAGLQTVAYFAGAIPYYTIYAIDIFDAESWLKRSFMVYFTTLGVGTLILAAEAHRKYQQFPEYVYKQGRTWTGMNTQELTLLAFELSSTDIGVQGFRCFIVSYRLLGSVVGILGTFMVIVLQFQETSSELPSIKIF